MNNNKEVRCPSCHNEEIILFKKVGEERECKYLYRCEHCKEYFIVKIKAK